MMKLGSYQLLRPIGRGGMGDIWLAAQIGPGGFKRPAVVKRLLESLTDEGEFLEMFLEEARLAALIHHPNVVSVFDFARDGETYFLAMEYVHGVTLRSLLKTAKTKNQLLPEPVVASIAAQALQGLAAAHELLDEHGNPLELVHRDVSPDNIMVGFDGMVKVLDFGIAKAATSAAVTRVGTMKGKLSYMPPEAAAGKSTDARGDIWSMGVVLYEALTQQRPFAADNDAALLASVVNAEPIPPLALNLSLSANFDSLVRYALAKSPEDRPSSARAFAEALAHVPGGLLTQQELSVFVRELIGEPAIQTVNAAMGMMPSNVSDRDIIMRSFTRVAARRWWSALAVLIAVVIAGVFGVWRYRLFEPPPDDPRPEPVTAEVVKPVPVLPKVVLTPKGPTPQPPVEVIADAGVDERAIDETATAPPGDAGDAATPKSDRAPVARASFLDIRASPWAEVTLDGKSLGPTPMGSVRVKPGSHTLVLSNPQIKKRKTMTVTVEAGKTKRIAVDLFD